MNSVQTVKYLLDSNKHMVISTADISGKPWVSPVFFVYDSEYNLYWISSKNTRHSQNIRENNRIAIVVFGTIPDSNKNDGVYFDAEAEELSDISKIEDAIKILNEKQQSDKYMITSIDEVSNHASWRIYKAVLKEVSKRVDIIDSESGQVINTREKIDLKSK